MMRETVAKLALPYPGREDRTVRVFVPAHEDGERLPVIYMTDGHNLFDRKTSDYGCWFTREAVRGERADSGKAAIIVGIHNNDEERPNDLTPKQIGPIVERELVPHGEVFDDFLLHTVLPAVEARFPVLAGREHTAFCGSSMGGLFAFYTVLRHPDVFSLAGVFSPALFVYDEQALFHWIQSRLGPTPPFLYFYTGGADPLEKVIRRCTERTDAFLRTCWPEDLLNLVVRPEQRHHESAWEPVFRDLLHLFLARQ